MSGPKFIQDSRDDRILSLNKVLKIHTIDLFWTKSAAKTNTDATKS